MNDITTEELIGALKSDFVFDKPGQVSFGPEKLIERLQSQQKAIDEVYLLLKEADKSRSYDDTDEAITEALAKLKEASDDK